MKPYEAIRHLGRRPQTYETWRKEDRDWADRVTQIRTRGRYEPKMLAFADFRQTYFNRSTPPHHARMTEAYERAKPGSITMVLGWPMCAKTSVLCDRTNYILGPVDPSYRIAVISEGRDLATKIVGQVAQRMTDEAMFGPYISAFGPFRGPDRAWNANYIRILGSAIDEKEASLEARGAGSTLYG